MVSGGVNYVAAVDSLVVDVNLQISSNQATATINNKNRGHAIWQDEILTLSLTAVVESTHTFTKGL
jgi:hypothetical protein